MKIFTKHEKILVILLSIGLVSGISIKYLRGGFDKNEARLELVGVDKSIQNVYKILNDPIIENIKEEKININFANKEELMKLSGVGPALAERILNKRNEMRKFNSIDELKLVKGIGEKLFKKNIDKISIGGNNE